jgi:uncharacterized protein (TIGR02217 family)
MPLVFPTLPGLAWSVTKSPTFQTRIQRAASGRELRALDYPYPLWQFTLVFDLLRDNPAAGYDELRTLMGFFMLCQGAFGTFLFRDPSDDQVAGQQIGVGNASTTVFQLQRAMGTLLPGGGFQEPIPAPNIVSAVHLDGITQSPASYSVDPNTGLVTLHHCLRARAFDDYSGCRSTPSSGLARSMPGPLPIANLSRAALSVCLVAHIAETGGR